MTPDKEQTERARVEALRLAVGKSQHESSTADEIVKDAKAFESFLLGKP